MAVVFRSIALAAMAWACYSVHAYGDPPKLRFALFKRIEANPEKEYVLSEKDGPWLILCATFSGETAQEQAAELVQELRARHKLEAFTHQVQFKHGEDQRPASGAMRNSRVRHRVERTREIAVLVGHYNTSDDGTAQKTLKRIKRLKPDCLDVKKRLEEGKSENRVLSGLRLAHQYVYEVMGSEKKERGPMAHAFITANPLLPDEYFSSKKLDDLIVRMNAPAKFSLLKCPGRYTVVVANFSGAVLLDQEDIQKVEAGRSKLPSMLMEAAEKAHGLTTALRKKGVEAYEFHDRNCSMVTVGSFDSFGTFLEDGSPRWTPQITAVIEEYRADQTPDFTAKGGMKLSPKQLDGIPFAIKPYPAEVPRAE